MKTRTPNRLKKAIALFVVGFVCAIAAYSFWPYLWKRSFYHFIAISFTGYTGAFYFLVKILIEEVHTHRRLLNRLSVSAFIIFLSALNSVLDEFFFDPKEIDINEYIAFVLFAFIVYKHRKKWTR